MSTTTEETRRDVSFPAQCECGHLFLERYLFQTPNSKGEVGFAWCGFCRTKRMVRDTEETRT